MIGGVPETHRKGSGMLTAAIIGSTGLRPHDLLTDVETRSVSVPTGPMAVAVGRADCREVAFLERSHGRPGVPPHAVDYRANALALKHLGVRCVLATAVVGSLSTTIPERALLVLDQFLDFTRRREATVFDGDGFAFVDMTDPYCSSLRAVLIEAARQLGVSVYPRGCYVGVDGPRYETRAEIEMYRRLGGDVIGMTSVPEVVMARELGLCYASLAFVSNMGAGLSPRSISRAENYAASVGAAPMLRRLLRRAVDLLPPDYACTCASLADDFVDGAR
jgi:5'-methylthioadenosine phosphorylase